MGGTSSTRIGVAIAERIKALVPKVEPARVAALAIEAREVMKKLRHAPLLVVREMARNEKHRALVADALERIIQRPDEMTELLAIYWADALGPQQQRAAARLGAGQEGSGARTVKFDAYQLAKYDRDGAVRIRDVLFLVHAKPRDADQEKVWKQLVDGELASPDTWEVSLSSGKDKRESFERLIAEKRLGGLALLRNLRLMQKAEVPRKVIAAAIEAMRTDRVLPYRFITAARYAPDFEPELESAMLKSIKGYARLPGRTRLLIDVSGSMFATLSAQSEMTRAEAACGLAILAREVCDEVEIFTFSNEVVKVPPRRGFALRDAVINSQPHGGTYLGKAAAEIDRKGVRLNRLHRRAEPRQGVRPQGTRLYGECRLVPARCRTRIRGRASMVSPKPSSRGSRHRNRRCIDAHTTTAPGMPTRARGTLAICEARLASSAIVAIFPTTSLT